MVQRSLRKELEDLQRFCTGFDVMEVIAAADNHGNADAYKKEAYALAILRAVRNGDFGDNRQLTHAAITATWERGHRKGFTADTFNEVFQEYFVWW